MHLKIPTFDNETEAGQAHPDPLNCSLGNPELLLIKLINYLILIIFI